MKKNKKTTFLQKSKNEDPNKITNPQDTLSDPISIDQCIRNLEQTITLPLKENINFHQMFILAEEKKYHKQLITSSFENKIFKIIFFSKLYRSF